MARPIVKYLDPVSGEYEFATVLDIGDLNKLNTSVKTDIVSAINSIVSGGVGGGSPIDDHRINQIEQVIKSLQDGTFDIVNFDSIDNYLRQEFLDGINSINEQNKIEMEAVLTQLDIHVNDVIQDYQERVAAQNVLLDNAQNTLVDARETLEDKAAELELANIGFSELEYDFNELDRYITANVRTIDFDNFNAMTEDYESVVAQTSNEVGVDMRGSTLSYLTGRVTDAEASISAQADEITSKMSYDEFQYMPIPKYDYGENLLFNTFDFHDMWIARNGAQVTQDTFLFGKIIAFNSPTGAYDTISDDLIVGESYVFTAYVNIQPSSKKPTEGRFEPVSGSYDPEDFQLQIGTKVFNPKVYESLLGINGWVRIQQEFVADAVNPAISINPVGVDGNNELAYMSMPKLEQGLTVTPWQPHLNDEYATLSSTQSMIKQQANSIVAFVTEVQQLDDSYKQATSTFQMLADGFKANTEAIEAYEEAVARYGTEYSNINGKFEQRVWRDDFQAVIEDINIDNRNRVLNSDFIRNHLDPSNRRLIVEDWSINEDWYIESTENNEYLCRKRTGLTNALATTATSNYFPVRNGERVLFSFELIHSELDDDKVFAIELFDITDRRLLKQEFSLESMTQVGNRYHGSFSLQSPGAEKGRVVLQLPKNGEVKFTRVSFQNADIGSVDWSPAPEDSWIIQSRLATYISQVEDEVTIGGVGRKLDTLTGLLSEDKGTFTLNPDKIATEVVNSKTYDDMGVVDKTNFEQTASGWMNEITSDGRLAGYVNATPDTYKISFDKIHLEGTTWADALGSSRITVTDRFALVGQNGRPVLDVKNDGSVAMNVTSLNIGSYSALTENDKGDIQDEVTQNVINTTQPYIHIAYADTIEGEGLAFNPSGKGFIGFAKSHLPTPSATASNYTWSKYVGKDGSEGDDGVGISGTIIEYATSSDGNNYPGTGWNSNIPDIPENHYLWTKTLWQYTDNTIKVAYSVSKVGKDGSDGKDGKDGRGIRSTITSYANHTNGTTPPEGGWSDKIPEPIKGQYQWTRSVINYTTGDPTTSYNVSYIPLDGQRGYQGNGVVSTNVTYAQTSNSTRPASSEWVEVMPNVVKGTYLWTRTIIKYADNTESESISVAYQAVDGKDGTDGTDGVDGADGVSIIGVTEYYLASNLKKGVTSSSNFPWTTNMPDLSESKPYLWNYETTQLSNGTSTAPTTPVIIGTYSEDGVSITGVSNQYALGTSNTVAPTTGWSDIPKPTTPEMKYLWNYEIISYSKGNPTETPKVVIGTHGASGSDGNPGKDGVGVKDTIVEYVGSDSGTVRPISGWDTTIPYVAPGDYIWTRTRWIYTDNTSEYGYTVSRIGKDGNRGNDGNPGKDGVGVDDTIIEYSTSLNGAVYPESGWQDTIPPIPDNHFLWTRTTWHYTDNTNEVAYSVSKVGKDGSDGRGISRTEIRYANHTSGTTAPTSGWSQHIPDPVKGEYQWTRTYVEYTEGDPTTSYSVSYIPLDGQRGHSGNGVVSSNITYAQTDTNVKPNASSWVTTMPTPTPGKYLWTRTVINYTDGSTSEAISVAYQAVDGYTPVKGKDYFDGKDGVSITSVVEKYKLSTLAEGETTSGTWDSTPKTPTRQLPYLWNYEIINYSEGNPTVTEPAVIGMYSADGTSIVSVEEFYALSTTTTRPAESSFTKTMKVTDEVNKYLWNKEVITLRHDDGSTTPESSYAIIGVHGKAGSDGVGISSTVIEYSVSSSGTTVPTSGWGRTVPTTNPGQYLWTRTTWTYTNNDVEYAYSVAYEGRNGNKGDDGVGIASTIIDYTASTSGTAVPTGGWNTKIPTVPVGSFLWTRTRWTYTNGDIETGYSVSRAARDGVSIVSVVEKYKLSTLLEGETTAGVWDNTPKAPTRELPYLWNYEIINYSSGSPTVTTPAVIGMYSADGTSIASVEELYALSSTPTQPADSLFTPGIKITNETNRYLWNKEVITLRHDDGTLEPKVHYALIGTHGVKGDDGRGVKETVVEYIASSSGTTTPSGVWSENIPSVNPGQYLWTRTKWIYTDNRTEYAYSVSYEGKNGLKGDDGIGVVSTIVEYSVSSSGTVTPTGGWSSTVPTVNEGQYLWTKTVWEYSDNNIETAYSVSRIGQDGKGIASTTIRYQSHTSGTSVPTGSWLASIPTVAEGNYLWTRTLTTYTDGDVVPTYSVSYYAKNGPKGETGVGIASSVVEYAQSSSGTVAPADSNFTKAIPSPVKGQYLWTRTLVTYTDGDTSTSYSTSYYAKDGPPGQSQYVHLRYSANANGSGYVPTPTDNTKYIGIAVTTSSTAPGTNTGYTWSKYAGDDGGRGLPGPPGDDGVTTYTWVKYADTETGVGLHDKPAGKKYIGLAFNQTDPTESTNPSKYQWSLMPQNIQVGGRNLLKASNVPVTNTSYPTQMYVMTEMMEVGQTYTLRLKGSLGAGKTNFGAWIDGGSISLGTLKDDGNGFYSMTFTGKKGSRSDHNVINIYPVSSSVTAESTIEWIKLEKGDVPTDWSPAPEEVQESIDETNSLATSARDIATLAEQIASENSRDLASLSATDFIIREGFYQDMLAKIQEDIETSNLKIGPISTTTENIEQNFVFGEAGMTIGRDDMSSKLNLTNDRISFINNNTEDSTYITGNTFYSHNIVVRDALTMINHTISNYEDKTVFRFVEKIEGE